MAYSSLAVANYFLQLATEHGKSVTPMKLQKLVYFAHAWHLAITGFPLLDEPVQAWQFGPVIPSLYHALKIYGSDPVTEPVAEFREIGKQFVKQPYSLEAEAREDDNVFTRALLRRIWDVYGKATPAQLSAMTHIGGSPWDEARKTAFHGRNVVIPDDEIERYFKHVAGDELNG